MKKVLALMLALVLVLSLVACGGGETKDDQSAEATEDVVEATEDPYSEEAMLALAKDPNTEVITASEHDRDCDENVANAKLKYCDKVFVVTDCYVTTIRSDNIDISPTTFMFDGYIMMYLPIEEIAGLKEGQKINVVGHFDKENPKSMDVAYLVQD